MLIANVAREVEAPLVLADTELEHWARIYVRLNLLHQGWTFEEFLRATPQVRADAEQRGAQIVQQLARIREQKQRAVRARVDYEARSAYSIAARLSPRDHQALKRLYEGFSARGNGERIEKLRHKRWPRRNHRDFIPES